MGIVRAIAMFLLLISISSTRWVIFALSLLLFWRSPIVVMGFSRLARTVAKFGTLESSSINVHGVTRFRDVLGLEDACGVFRAEMMQHNVDGFVQGRGASKGAFAGTPVRKAIQVVQLSIFFAAIAQSLCKSEKIRVVLVYIIVEE